MHWHLDVLNGSSTLTLPLGDDATLLCFHGSPRSNADSIHVTTPDTALARMLEGYSATVFAGGRTHAPFARRYRQEFYHDQSASLETVKLRCAPSIGE